MLNSSMLLIDVYALFLTLVSDGRLRQARLRNSRTAHQGDVNLFNHLVRKADVAGCCSAGSVLRCVKRFAPYSVSLICIV